MTLCRLLLQKWLVLKEVVSVLQIVHNVTIFFQQKKLTLSDVYGRWLGMELHLDAYSKRSTKTVLAKLLFEETKTRKIKIFDNPLMACALYLDPRFHMELHRSYHDKVAEAKETMLTIWRRLNIIHPNDNNSMVETAKIDSSNDSSFEFDELLAVQKHLQRGNGNDEHQNTENEELQNNSISTRKHCEDIETIINLFQPEAIPLNSSILDYWENMKEKERELYRIASVVFSVPPTEVAIERDFSHLDSVFTKRRGNLCHSRLEDIFVIHLNRDLFEAVTQEEISELYKELDVKATPQTIHAKKNLQF